MFNLVLDFTSQHLYLLSGLYFLTISLFVFHSLKEYPCARRNMIAVGVWFAVVTPIIAHLTLQDWWSPAYLNNASAFVRLEDALFGFAIGSLSSGLSAKTSGSMPQLSRFAVMPVGNVLILSILPIVTILGLFHYFGLGSFYSAVLSMVITIMVCSAFARGSNLLSSLISGIALLLVALPGYWFASSIHPEWIEEYWLLQGWPMKLLFTIPIGEYIYYILTGALVSSFQNTLLTDCRSARSPSWRSGSIFGK